ncbi:Lines C-terminus [Carex littledalei]|uniref:Lines C-terminus n=1 Tax=Carex littledalei TaxID=544730 RepID=A0A833VH52_9POAL|nr:Lines C-terminus [Carex littledalei]
MLFCMLLQFLDASVVAFQIQSKWACYNELHLLSSIINPVCLFHILLFSLKYDHMVLIDYLISKDTGVLCARYLLRCLRFVSQSWQSFAKFSTSELEVTGASSKRRKLSDEDGAFTSSKAFGDAKECLISLKNKLEELCRKNLFPYNPKALLRSLSRFQELCGQ